MHLMSLLYTWCLACLYTQYIVQCAGCLVAKYKSCGLDSVILSHKSKLLTLCSWYSFTAFLSLPCRVTISKKLVRFVLKHHPWGTLYAIFLAFTSSTKMWIPFLFCYILFYWCISCLNALEKVSNLKFFWALYSASIHGWGEEDHAQSASHQ